MIHIEYKGVRKTAAAWGCKNVQRRIFSMDIDMLTLDVPRGVNEAAIFEDRETIKVFRQTNTDTEQIQWFVGRVVASPRGATGRFQGHQYVLAGPWWYLENLVFQQSWKEYVNPLDLEAGTTTKLRSHLLLNLTVNGTYLNTTQQITSALEYCLECAAAKGLEAPFQVGTIDLPLAQPYTFEVVDITCAEVIHRQAKWTPDAVGWFDYSTSPPTFHLKQRSSLAKVALQWPGKPDNIRDLSLRARLDIQVPSVVIKYEAVDTVNGTAYARVVLDVAGPDGSDGREFGGLVTTVNLEGSVASYTNAAIICEAITPNDADWWKTQYEPFTRGTIRGLTITGVERSGSLPRYLSAGSITGWMLAANNASYARETIKALATYEVMDDEDPQKVLEKRVGQPVSVDLVATDLVTGNYRSSFEEIPAEPVPSGLAAYLFAAVNALHFDGSFNLVDECSGKVSVGSLLNITGIRDEYLAMDAQVQSITETVDDGVTQVTVGPPKHLGKDDIIEFLQTNRGRVRYTSTAALTSGISLSASPISLGKETPQKNSNANNGKLDKFTVAQHIVMDRVDNPASRPIRLRELTYCDRGTEKKVLVLASDLY